jgi:ceramide glucosyltransferase
LHLLRLAVLILAVGPIVYYLLATYCAWAHFRPLRKAATPDRSFHPAVSILKPVRGLDREAYENFASFCQLDYPEVEILFAVSSQADPAAAVIEKLQRDFPERQIRLLTDVPYIGANDKVNKLCLLAKEAKYDVLVISDSDVRVEPDCLFEVTAPLARPEVGLVTALFRSLPGERMASKLEALGVPAASAASALIAEKLEGNLRFAFGWMMATTKQRLAEIGGFEAIAHHHSDDFEVGNRIASKGHRVEFMRKHVWMVFPNETIGELLRREMRWSVGLRNVREMGYLGLAFTFGLPWALLAAIVAPDRAIAAAIVLAYLASRLLMAWTVGVWGIGDPATRRNLWLVPVRDAIDFAVWVGGWFSNRIQWRGRAFVVEQGLLIPVSDGSQPDGAWRPSESAPQTHASSGVGLATRSRI